MSGRVTRLKQAVPLLHFRLVQSYITEHGDPIAYIDLFVHVYVLNYCVFRFCQAMTGKTLNREVVDGSNCFHRPFGPAGDLRPSPA